MPTNHKRTKPASKVLIVDDHPAVREALALRISMTPNLDVVGEAGDETEALRLYESLQPDIAVIDLSLKTGDGLDLIKRIKSQDKSAKLLVWSMHSESLFAERALRAGALGYITKEQATGQIVDAISQVLAGKIYLSPAMTERMIHRITTEGANVLERTPIETLSDRELEVLRAIGKGLRTADIAQQLHLSVKTIETYRDRIRQKLNLSDGNELHHYAVQWVLNET